MSNTTSKQVSDATGTLWAYIQNWAARGISLVVFFVLVRILSPAEFGTFAITMVFITVGEVFVEQLFGHAIVQRKELTESHLNSAFWATLPIGAGLTAASILGAPYFAAAFDSPGSAPLIIAITPVFLFMALSSVPAALLFRELDYRTLTRRTALSNLLSGAAAIAAASAGLGVWTFVIQQLVFQSVSTAVLWYSAAWRPRRHFQFQALGGLASFSARVTAGRLLELVETRVVELIIARTLGIVAIGNFSVATRAQAAATQILAAPLWTSSVPIFARRQAVQDDLLSSLKERSFIAALVVMPAFLFAAATSNALVPAVFGEQWHDAVAPFQWLCVLIALRAVTALYGAMLQAVGAAGAVATNTLIRVIATMCSLPFLLQYGPGGAAASLFFGQLVSVPCIVISLRKQLGWSFLNLTSHIFKPMIAALIAAAVGLIVTRATEGASGQKWGLLAGVLTCGMSFLTLISLIIPARLLALHNKLPSLQSKITRSFLAAIIRAEDSAFVAVHSLLINARKQCRDASAPVRDFIILPGDAYSISGSVGDQALFGGLIELLREAGIAKVRVLCRPGVAMPVVEGLELEPLPLWGSYKKAGQLSNAICNSRGLIVVGADTLDGFYSRFESLLRLELATFAASRNIPSILCSFSFNEAPDAAAVRAFRKLPLEVTILCRDAVSQRRLTEVVGTRVELTADLGYLLKPSVNSGVEQAVTSWLKETYRGNGPVIGWNMSPHAMKLLSSEQRTRATSSAATTIARLVYERDATVVLVPHDFRSHASDPAMLADIYSQIDAAVKSRVFLPQGPYSASDVKQLCQYFDFVFTGRMHLMIAALGRDVPVLAMEYQGKFAGTLAHFGLGAEHLMEPAEVCSPAQLFQRVSRQLDNLSATRQQIQKLRPSVQQLASIALMHKLGRQQ